MHKVAPRYAAAAYYNALHIPVPWACATPFSMKAHPLCLQYAELCQVLTLLRDPLDTAGPAAPLLADCTTRLAESHGLSGVSIPMHYSIFLYKALNLLF